MFTESNNKAAAMGEMGGCASAYIGGGTDCYGVTDATYYFKGATSIDVTGYVFDSVPSKYWPEGIRVKLIHKSTSEVKYTSSKGVMAPGRDKFVGYRSIPISNSWADGTYYVWVEFYDNNLGEYYAGTPVGYIYLDRK